MPCFVLIIKEYHTILHLNRKTDPRQFISWYSIYCRYIIRGVTAELSCGSCRQSPTDCSPARVSARGDFNIFFIQYNPREIQLNSAVPDARGGNAEVNDADHVALQRAKSRFENYRPQSVRKNVLWSAFGAVAGYVFIRSYPVYPHIPTRGEFTTGSSISSPQSCS